MSWREERLRLLDWLKETAEKYNFDWNCTCGEDQNIIFKMKFSGANEFDSERYYRIEVKFFTDSFNTRIYRARRKDLSGYTISHKTWKFVKYPKERFAPIKDSQEIFEDYITKIIKEKKLKEPQTVLTKDIVFRIFDEEYSRFGGTCFIKPRCHTSIGNNHRINEYIVINGKNCGPKICIIREYTCNNGGSWFTFSGIDEVTGNWRYIIHSADTEDDIRCKMFDIVNRICTGLRYCHNRLFESGATKYLRPDELIYMDHDEDILCKVMCAIKENTNNMSIKKVIFNNPATIVLWEDGTKTVVKKQKGERWDKEKGLAMAIVKKMHGNKSNYNDIFKKWCEE